MYVFLQLVPAWALEYGVAGILAFVLGYVVWQFVIRRLQGRVSELEEENDRLREILMETREEKHARDIDYMEKRIQELKETIAKHEG